jgi:hypothetical protein
MWEKLFTMEGLVGQTANYNKRRIYHIPGFTIMIALKEFLKNQKKYQWT